jgi:hypothetical protein
MRKSSQCPEAYNDWQQARPNSARVPCMFLLDEANKWLPQNITESCIGDRDVLYLLQRAIFGTMVRRGGKRGLGVVLTTQRIAELDKRAMQSIWKFLFQQGEEVDLARYGALGLDKEEVLTLQQGECFIFSPSVIGFRTLIRQRYSPHLGHTPGLAPLAAHLMCMPPVEIVSARRYTSVESRIESGSREAYDLPEEGSAREPARGEAREKAKTELERALEAWNDLTRQGITPSGRKLATAMGISEGAGNRLMNALKAKGLIVEAQKGDRSAPEDE